MTITGVYKRKKYGSPSKSYVRYLAAITKIVDATDVTRYQNITYDVEDTCT